MSSTNGPHPPADRLRAFSQGRLDDTDSAAVEAHLVDCLRCCEALEGMKEPDAFLSWVKAAGPRGADERPGPSSIPVASSPSGEEARTHKPRTTEGSEAVPQGLRDHPRYRVLGVLGSGGMGTVFKAEHRLLERPVVIKVLHPELIRDAELLERFRREARLAARLAHPNVVTVYEAEQIGPMHLLVMEFIGGEDLAELVRKRGPMPVAVACELARQAAAGLQHIHEQRLVHRGIQPAHLVLTDTGPMQ